MISRQQYLYQQHNTYTGQDNNDGCRCKTKPRFLKSTIFLYSTYGNVYLYDRQMKKLSEFLTAGAKVLIWNILPVANSYIESINLEQ